MRQHIWSCLRRAAEEGVAVLMTSHSASEADAVCDKLGENGHTGRSLRETDLTLKLLWL